MKLTNGRLTESQLRKLSEEHDQLVEAKHRWCWKQELLSLINSMRIKFPQWTDKDIFERVGGSYVDWQSQEFADEVDWDISLNEITEKYQLNTSQRDQLKFFLMGQEEDLEELIAPQTESSYQVIDYYNVTQFHCESNFNCYLVKSSNNDLSICSSCYSRNYFKCDGCGHLFDLDYIARSNQDKKYCNQCI